MRVAVYSPALALVFFAGALSSQSGQQVLWEAHEELRLGGWDKPDESLTRVVDLAVGADGRVYVADGFDSMIRVFGPGGDYLGSVGRRGSGPGEFLMPATLGFRGDTLWVGDPGSRRITRFAPEQKDTVTLGFLGVPVGWSPYLSWRGPTHLLSDGTTLAIPAVPIAFVSQGLVKSVPWVRCSPNGDALDAIFEGSLERHFISVANPATGALSSLDQPFTDDPLADVGRDGSRLVVVDRRVTPLGESPWRKGSFKVTILNIAGDTLSSSWIPFESDPIRDSDVERWVGRQVEDRVEAGLLFRGFEAGLRSELYLPQHWPPVSELVPGRDHTVWLGTSKTTGGRRLWLVLDEQGREEGRFWLPTETKVFEADRTQIWGVEEDQMDVPYVVKYSVIKK